MRLRWSLILLVVGAVLPVAVFAVFVGTLLVQQEQDRFVQSIQARNRALMSAVDAELTGHIETLRIIAATESLGADNLAAFHREAVGVLKSQPKWDNLILSSPQGQQLVNADVPFGEPLPTRIDPESVRHVVEIGSPLIVDLRLRPLSETYAIPVRFPIKRGADVKYVLTAVLRPDVFQQLLQDQRLPGDWVVALVDRERRFIARVPFLPVGGPVAEAFAEAIKAGDEGWYRGETREGVDSFTAFLKSPQTHFTLGMAMPAATVLASTRRVAGWMTAAGAICLLFAATVALYVGRRISGPISQLASAVGNLDDVPPPAVNSHIREIRELAAAMEKAFEAIRGRQRVAEKERLLLANADRAKDEFLAMLSHELRNPLAAIVTSVQLLKLAEADSAVATKARDIIERQSKHMNRLIDDLLDVSRIVVGKANMEMAPLDLADVASRLVETWQTSGRLDQHGVALETKGSAWIIGDRVRMEQVLGNLLHNAVKFSEQGTTIDIAVEAVDRSVRVTMADHGKGLTETEISRIFELFVQGDQDLSRAAGGMGIGLAVVQRLVHLHGGTIRVHSAGPGHGSRFVVELPAAPMPRAAARHTADDATSRCIKVLLVDDNDDARTSLCELLTVLGHEVRATGSSHEALVVARSGWPDCALLDIGLPDIDGYELARQIHAEAPSIRLVAVTGYGQSSDRQRALAAGFADHLTKPVSREVLSGVLAA